MRFATTLVGPSDAADVVSNVMVRTLAGRRLASLDNPQAYLMKAVLNEARALGRDRSRRSEALARVGVAAQVVGPESEDNRELLDAVMALPMKQRAAVYLAYWVGLDSAQAAVVMGCRPATVRRYLHLARAKLERFVR
jgi:RNA polymerase sigma-70 factor (ECF subfamily)